MKLIINDIYGCLIEVADLDQAIEQVNGYIVFLKTDPKDGADVDCIAYWDDIQQKLTHISL